MPGSSELRVRYFIYLRKSTDREDTQVLSIESQRDELREFAHKHGLLIVDEVEESRSAKRPGRKAFNRMLERVEAGEADGIVAWHPDRLSRNAMDGGKLIDLLEIGSLASLRFPTFAFENTSQGRFFLGMAFIQGKYYVDTLGENTKRGLRKKVRLGECPTKAVIGYLNDRLTKRWVVDPQVAPVVRSAFELYATGEATLDDVCAHFTSRGVVTQPTKRFKGGKPHVRSRVALILKDPAYYGHFRYAGEVYEGTHEPIITKALYDQVQLVFAQSSRFHSKPKTPKPFLGLFRCAECGGAITAEIQKGHIYYRCTKKSKNLPCSQPYVREGALNDAMSSMLREYGLSRDMGAQMLARLEQERAKVRDGAKAEIARLKQAVGDLGTHLEILLQMRLTGEIDAETFLAKKASLLSKKKTHEENIGAVSRGNTAWLEPMREWIFMAQRVGENAVTGTLTEKKTLASKIFGSNLLLDRKIPRGEAMNPWPLLLKTRQGETLVHLFEAARTHFQGQLDAPQAAPRVSPDLSPPGDTLRC